jgi:hypothetical protein
VKIDIELGFIAGVRRVRPCCAYRREDGTRLPPCAALFRFSDAVRSVEARHGHTLWRVEEFDDGSRRVIVTAEGGVPLSVYPVHQSERLEDVKGIPAHVLKAAEEADIARVRRGPLCDADRALLAEVGLAERPASPLVEVWASGRDVILHPEVAVYPDGSALRGRIVHERWQDAVDALDGFIKVVPLRIGWDELGQSIKAYARARLTA